MNKTWAVLLAIAGVLILGAFRQTYKLALTIIGIVVLVWALRWASEGGPRAQPNPGNIFSSLPFGGKTNL